MWKRLSVLWALVRGDARQLWLCGCMREGERKTKKRNHIMKTIGVHKAG
jgi:hypothetical protein